MGRKEVAFLGKVSLTVVGLPGCPHLVVLGKHFPLVGCLWKVVRGEDGGGCKARRSSDMGRLAWVSLC